MNKIKSFFQWFFPRKYSIKFNETTLAEVHKGWFTKVTYMHIQELVDKTYFDRKFYRELFLSWGFYSTPSGNDSWYNKFLDWKNKKEEIKYLETWRNNDNM